MSTECRPAAQVIRRTDESGFGKGTVYRHFGNKEELFLATARHCVRMVDAIVRRKAGDDARSDTIQSWVFTAGTSRSNRREYQTFEQRGVSKARS